MAELETARNESKQSLISAAPQASETCGATDRKTRIA
jgi:hypothetical protein